MLYSRFDHLIVPVSSIERASAPFERLGLTLTPLTRHAGRGTENRALLVNPTANEFYVELLGIADEADARTARGDEFVQAVAEGRTVPSIALGVEDMAATLAALATHGIERTAIEVFADDGRKVCDAAFLDDRDRALMDVTLVQYPEPMHTRAARHAEAGLFRHAQPLKRLDHLAAVAPDLEAATRYWEDVLGVPVFGEVRTPVMIIRQFKVGDAIMELLGPATPESPMASRPPGLVSMVAFEVDDVAAAVAHARTAGFTVADPSVGALPGTRTATIPAAELGGVALQLLQYV